MMPGFELSVYHLNMVEGAAPEAFDVLLTAEPDSDVVFDISSRNPAEVAAWPVRLTFTPENWALPQSVWLTAVDDAMIDGPQMTEISVRVDPNASDSDFAWLPQQSMYVSTQDNDVAGFALSKTALTVSESVTAAIFTVALTAQPRTYVTLVAIGDNEAEATVDPAVLTFSPSDWNQPQTITVTGVDDPRIDGDQTTRVTVEVAAGISDGDFAALEAQRVVVTTTDDDVAGFTLSKTIAVVSEAGTTDTFRVVLTAQPETNVRLTVSGSDPSEASVHPAELVFSPADWDVPQAVTITGVDDAERDGAQESSVTVAVDAQYSDGEFAELAAQFVFVTSADNDYGWHNPDNPFDTDGDGFVTANDALLLINYINRNSGNPVLPTSLVSPPPYYDVNDDNLCTALDILLVINFINTHSAAATSSSGEGERSSGEERGDTSQDVSPARFLAPLETQPIAAVQSVSGAQEPASVGLSVSRLASPPVVWPAVPSADLRHASPSVRINQRASDDWPEAVDAALQRWELDWVG